MKGIVIGAGKSVMKSDILNRLGSMSWNNNSPIMFICDRMLYAVKDFDFNSKKVITCTTEDTLDFEDHFYGFYKSLPSAYSVNIKTFLSCQVRDNMIRMIEELHYQIGGYYHRFPYPCNNKIDDGSFTIYDGANVGVALIWVANLFYGIRDIATVGIDLEKSEFDGTNSDYDWEGELQQSIQSCLSLAKKDVRIYNCNPNGEGRFHTPIRDSTLETFIKI